LTKRYRFSVGRLFFRDGRPTCPRGGRVADRVVTRKSSIAWA